MTAKIASRRGDREMRGPGLPASAVLALGIVYGDLGTSPLYTMQVVLSALGGRPTPEAALGVLSLIFWTLLIVVSVKYSVFVLRADNHGEGGVMALMSLVGMNDWRRGTLIGASMGLLGAALIYGDGAITPAISVLSALEGVNVATQTLKPFVLPLTLGVLVGLFAAQRLGTAAIGRAFGPVMLLWFFTIGVLGLLSVVHHPQVLVACDPRRAVALLTASGPKALLILGGVFLCVTGAEALYADMGHIGPIPIRVAWYVVVLPALLLSYAGQTALLIEGAPGSANLFFSLAPSWGVIPLVTLATIATIIASQAIITGTFSMTRQAMQLGWLPGFHIRQTSDKVYGQIYVPAVNLMMAVATIGVTVAFGSSDKLAGAYGTAVSTTMVLTTLLLLRAMHVVWRWPLMIVAPLGGLLLAVDLAFFSANLVKVLEGGWIPLTLGAVIFVVMVTWRTGVQEVRKKLAEGSRSAEDFFTEIRRQRVARVPGTAIFLTKLDDAIPSFVSEYVHNIKSLHENVIALHVVFEEQPRVNEVARCRLADANHAIWHVTLRYGFMEVPDLSNDLDRVRGLPPKVDLKEAMFFSSRDIIVPQRHAFAIKWRYSLFAFLFRNSIRVTDRFNLPPERSLELARHVEL